MTLGINRTLVNSLLHGLGIMNLRQHNFLDNEYGTSVVLHVPISMDCLQICVKLCNRCDAILALFLNSLCYICHMIFCFDDKQSAFVFNFREIAAAANRNH